MASSGLEHMQTLQGPSLADELEGAPQEETDVRAVECSHAMLPRSCARSGDPQVAASMASEQLHAAPLEQRPTGALDSCGREDGLVAPDREPELRQLQRQNQILQQENETLRRTLHGKENLIESLRKSNAEDRRVEKIRPILQST